ncbi:YchJ family metal-binding protein [Budvicia aquatica]|uniref:YchJ family metal-binding protein n=1 Tax=Budvicia aquatica TaxID=82979 RepID=UPI0021C35AA1|nr:YchJ family metal-binding protein [Budvicia aquatica]
MSKPCPCGSLKNFTQCCYPLISQQAIASTPSALMRSRYSAYVTQDVEYLISTWHDDYRIANLTESVRLSFENTEWQSLTVIKEELGNGINEGYVEFIAKYRDLKTDRHHVIHERSHFIKQDGRWYYTSGIKPQVGRNEQCPCGSMRKYKKCCDQD